ncbi:hypothetical protein BD289DRAFT_378375 [Coniella lustricola]|uniref:Hepatocellular carcinoma-associated antigen 59-domain-containing protein n=1 Tax=Coniella lustricola TaxID=2025994 RepID=A0A2T2ZU51_9PEZI|nr:hypothetical protein BD289DRAFT_378375 [Coniella lustricola]
MDTSDSPQDPAPQVVFRPSKKRKHLRQRAEESSTASADTTSPAAALPIEAQGDEVTHSNEQISASESTETEGLSVAEIKRLRNARKSKLKGVEFRPESAKSEAAPMESSFGLQDDSEPVEVGVARRFAPQAGIVGELVNKHMEEYIESELARRHAADKANDASTTQTPESSKAEPIAGLNTTKKVEDRPTMGGRLQEIDLGQEARMRTALMTEQARKRLAGELVEDESDNAAKRVRLGPDGKPWRGRKRRASEDVKRDQMVEALMRENKLDVYDVPSHPGTSIEPEPDEAADTRIAEEFRREFMDAMAERRNQRRRPAANASKSTAKQEEILRGPKLGGSRNARAAMRDILLSQQEKDKKRR